MNKIGFYSRRSGNGWLSNFQMTEQEVDGVVYQSNEHYYQSRKAKAKEIQDWIASAPTPFLAMKGGQSLRIYEMVEGWHDLKVEVMLKGLRAKFKNSELRQKLLGTGNARLFEDSPTDKFWGVKGKDLLGKLLMQVRDEIRGEEYF